MNHHNYLLLIPSLMRDGCTDISYNAADGRTYLGSQTNIAATQHIMDRLHDKGQQLDRILMVCSDQVLEKAVRPAEAEAAVTSLAYYETAISNFGRKLGYSEAQLADLFRPFSQAQINPGNYSAMEQIQQQMSQEIDRSGRSGLYLDFTGGQRDASMLLVFFARLLEHRGAQVQDVLYSKIDQGGKTGHIESCMDTYRLFYRLDDITSSQYGDLTRLEKGAREMGCDHLAQEASETHKAVQQQKAGNYLEAEKKAKKLEPSPVNQGLVQELYADTLNKQREKLTVENTLKEDISSGNLKNAVQIIRENGIRLLVQKNLVRCPRWMIKDDYKCLNQNFTVYARYYGTYLSFIEDMLRQLQDCEDRDQLRERYAAYMQEHTRLTPSAHRCPAVNDHLLREFSQENPQIQAMLDQKLIDSVMGSAITLESLTRAMAEYERERSAYLAAYLTTGFPFGNVDRGYSNSCITIYRSRWEDGRRSEEKCRSTYAQEYLKLLDRSMDQLLQEPMDQVRYLIAEALRDPDQLPRLFPPLCVGALFSPADRDYQTFGQRVRLIDQVRKQRNVMVHAGQKVSDEFMEKADRQVMAFAQWLTQL